jgi:hypothetical protein
LKDQEKKEQRSFDLKQNTCKKEKVMVQSNILRGTTQSGKANATWYLQRLTASADNRTRYSNNSLHTDKNFEKNSKTRVEKGNITQGQYTPTKQVNFYLNIFVKLNFLKFN